MRTTLKRVRELWAKAKRLIGIRVTAAQGTAGLRTLIERDSARRLARLGGSEPRLKPISRRRSETFPQ